MSSNKRNVVVLGATGSIGRSAAAELEEHADRFQVVALAAGSNVPALAALAEKFHPRLVAVAEPGAARELDAALPSGVRGACGAEALIEAATLPEADIVLCAIVGIAGVEPVIAALRAGKRVALASKEVLVMAGELVMAEARRSPGGGIVPVDSEHSGLFQCLAGRAPDEIARLWLTASGGPFREWSAERIAGATAADALRHPTWSMGRKVTIDSASMMNKALELIEAHHLFGVPGDRLDVVINPQSTVHALVELVDSSFIAQLSSPDMRLAIRYALSYPERLGGGTAARLDLGALKHLDFEIPDRRRFPSLDFAREAMAHGGSLPAVMNAANDVAVDRFCAGEIGFAEIWEIVGAAMARFPAQIHPSLAELRTADRSARDFAAAWRPRRSK